MRYGIVSDIHSNLTALEAVIRKLVDVDLLISPGDIVGYGPDPNECCAALRAADCRAVIGNHDAFVAGLIEESWFRGPARAAAEHNRAVLTPANLSYVGGLPVSHTTDEFLVVHATADQPLGFHYVFSPDTARRCLDAARQHRICFIGHTHRAEVYTQRSGNRPIDCLQLVNGGKIELEDNCRYVINCGSVGQPRDGNPDAAFGIYDSDLNTVEMLRVPYDISSVQSRMAQAGLPASLISRLEEGK